MYSQRMFFNERSLIIAGNTLFEIPVFKGFVTIYLLKAGYKHVSAILPNNTE